MFFKGKTISLRAKTARQLIITASVCGGICLLLWLFPSLMGSGLSAQESEMLREQGIFGNPDYAGILQAVKDVRYSLVKADAIRSFIFILLGTAAVWLYLSGKMKSAAAMTACVAAICLIDLFAVNKRYVNSDNFTNPDNAEATFEMNDADRQILADKDPNFRVLDIDGFGSARSSYFHKTIGGYHAAKLTRYNDLIEHQLQKNNPNVLNMLNTKYVMGRATDEKGQPMLDNAGNEIWLAQHNPDALGNAWWVREIAYADSDNDEMAALDTLNTALRAVANKSFASVLGQASADSTATVIETAYAPNRLAYKTSSKKDGIVVFSEIYFPWGWTATIDGKEAPIARANYVLARSECRPEP